MDKKPDYHRNYEDAEKLLKERLTAMDDNPDRKSILKRAKISEDQVYSFLEIKSENSEWQFETFIAHAAILHSIAEQEETRFSILPSEVKDSDYSDVIKEAMLYEHRRSNFLINDFTCKFASQIHGMAVAFDGWRTEERTCKYIVPAKDKEGEIIEGKFDYEDKTKVEYDDAISKLIPVKNFFWDELAEDMHDVAGMSGARDAAYLVTNQSVSATQNKYKGNPFFKNLDKITKGDIFVNIINKKGLDTRFKTTQEIHYFSYEHDLYIVATPGKDSKFNIIRTGPNPYNHKHLPFTVYKNEKIIKLEGSSMAGYPIPLKIRNNERGIRKLVTMHVLQNQRALDNPVFYKSDLDFEEEDLKNPDWFKDMISKSNDKKHPDHQRDQSPFIPVNTPGDNIANSFFELQRADPPNSTPQVVDLINSQIITDSLIDTSVFRPSNESATLTGVKRESFSKLVKLISRQTDKALERRLFLQLSNIEQFFTTSKFGKVSGEEKIEKIGLRSIRIDKKIAEEVEIEKGDTEIKKYTFRDADQDDEQKYSFVEINNEMFSIQYDIIVEPTELSTSEIQRRQSTGELIKLATQVLSVAPKNIENMNLTEIFKVEASKLGFSPEKIFDGTMKNPDPQSQMPEQQDPMMQGGMSQGAMPEQSIGTDQGNIGPLGDNMGSPDPASIDKIIQAQMKSQAPGNLSNNQL
jgi:hypothetical protein